MNKLLSNESIKGPIKFVSEDQLMQILILKSEEVEIINPCKYKNSQNKGNGQFSEDFMDLYEKVKGIKHLVVSVFNKMDGSIKKGG